MSFRGKSLDIPEYILAELEKKVVVDEPRVLPRTALDTWIAEHGTRGEQPLVAHMIGSIAIPPDFKPQDNQELTQQGD